MGTASLERTAGSVMYAVTAESPTLFPTAWLEKTKVVSVTSERLLDETLSYKLMHWCHCMSTNNKDEYRIACTWCTKVG